MTPEALAAEIARTPGVRVPDATRIVRLAAAGTIDRVVIVGSSGTGKTTLIDGLRREAMPGVDVPARFVTRPRRDNDSEAENLHLGREELERRAAAGELGLRWVRRMEGGRLEHYAFPPPAAGKLAVYSANNALYAPDVEISPPEALRRAFFLGIYAPDPVREARLRVRSPDLWRDAPGELAERMADAPENVLGHVHAVIDNHGASARTAPAALARIIALLLTAAACGPRAVGPQGPAAGEPVADLPAGAPFFVAGEQITWDVSVLGVGGAHARMAVGQPGLQDGRRAIAAVFEVESGGVLATLRRHGERVESLVDLETGVPLRTEFQVEAGDEPSGVTALRRGRDAELSSWRGTAPEKQRVQPLPSAGTHDAVSAILALRAWRAGPGSRARYYILDGEALWRSQVVVERSEPISVPLGERRAVRVSGSSTRLSPALADDPSVAPRRFTYWFSDDDERVPLRVVSTTAFGTLDMRATSYAAPEAPSSPASTTPPARMGSWMAQKRQIITCAATAAGASSPPSR